MLHFVRLVVTVENTIFSLCPALHCACRCKLGSLGAWIHILLDSSYTKARDIPPSTPSAVAFSSGRSLFVLRNFAFLLLIGDSFTLNMNRRHVPDRRAFRNSIRFLDAFLATYVYWWKDKVRVPERSWMGITLLTHSAERRKATSRQPSADSRLWVVAFVGFFQFSKSQIMRSRHRQLATHFSERIEQKRSISSLPCTSSYNKDMDL